MTRQEILNTPEIVDFMIDKSVMVDSKMKLHKRLEELCKLAIKALEQEDVLDKITAEIWEEAEWAYSDFDDYKETVLEAEPNELPDDEFRFGLHRAVEIINKYKAESEDKE